MDRDFRERLDALASAAREARCARRCDVTVNVSADELAEHYPGGVWRSHVYDREPPYVLVTYSVEVGEGITAIGTMPTSRAPSPRELAALAAAPAPHRTACVSGSEAP